MALSLAAAVSDRPASAITIPRVWLPLFMPRTQALRPVCCGGFAICSLRLSLPFLQRDLIVANID